jgi:hypothetical protein
MKNDPQEMKFWPTRKRIAVMQAEIDARHAALEGGAPWGAHFSNITWLAGAIWDLENEDSSLHGNGSEGQP